jgi:MscS family membrane protein
MMNTIESSLSEVYLWIPNWKWLALALGLPTGWLLKALIQSLIYKLKSLDFWSERGHRYFQLAKEQPFEGPSSWLIVFALGKIGLDFLQLSDRATKYLNLFLQASIALMLLRLIYLAMDAFGKWFQEHVQKTDSKVDDQIAPFITKTLKVLVIIFGILAILQNFGLNVFSVMAGLGLGGLALTLAAQDTAANVFGSIQILFDKPFTKGDYIKIGDVEGLVEDVGFRSTRIRTFYDSIVSIPNATIAKERIDNLGLRQVRRIRHVLGFTYDTPEEKLTKFMESLRAQLVTYDLIEKENITVRLIALGDFNLQVLLQCYVRTNQIDQERKAQEEILFLCLSLAQSCGVEFAFPTATHYVKST